jgi:hypothetical protein
LKIDLSFDIGPLLNIGLLFKIGMSSLTLLTTDLPIFDLLTSIQAAMNNSSDLEMSDVTQDTGSKSQPQSNLPPNPVNPPQSTPGMSAYDVGDIVPLPNPYQGRNYGQI